MPHGREVGLRPNHVVLDGDPPPLKSGAQHPPNFHRALRHTAVNETEMPIYTLLAFYFTFNAKSINTYIWFITATQRSLW